MNYENKITRNETATNSPKDRESAFQATDTVDHFVEVYTQEVQNVLTKDRETIEKPHQKILETQRTRARRELTERHQSMLAPVHRLPNEILSGIFLHDSAPFDPIRDGFPWILGHVCQRWRDIALSTPALWCSYEIDLRVPWNLTKDSFHRTVIPRFSECISRSGQHPLSLVFMRVVIGWRDSVYIDTIVTLFRDHSHRCIRVAQTHELKGLWEADCLPRLRSLGLSYSSLKNFVIKSTEFAPRLSRLSLSYCDFEQTAWADGAADLFAMAIPWPKLSHFSWDENHLPLSRFPLFFAMMPALRILEISGTGEEFADPITEKIVLANLTTLNLATPASFMAYFFQRLESPLLRDLRIRVKGVRGSSVEALLTTTFDTISRLNLHDQLENLSLEGFQPSASIVPILCQTPKVTSFYTDILTSKIVESLISGSSTDDGPSVPFLPMLQTLVIEYYFPILGPSIIELIESRLRKIKSVRISAGSNGHGDEALIEGLRRLEDAGGPEVVLETSAVGWNIPYSE